jgi:uncharacterized membrane protein
MEEQTNQTQNVPQGDKADVEKNKAMAIVGYIIPILFFIPLISDGKNSPFAKFHANQQLVLLIAAVVINIVGGIIPFLGWFIILPLGCIFLLVVAIMGIISASKGEMKKLPLIGGIEILK